jgi:hypothetical protein
VTESVETEKTKNMTDRMKRDVTAREREWQERSDGETERADQEY